MINRDALALLDLEKSERFALSEAHEDLVDAADLPWDVVADCLTDPRIFLTKVAGDRRMRRRDAVLLQASWRAQQGLVDGDDLTRLLWTVSRFGRQVEVDLQRVGVDFGELWRGRRWRLLLNLIDHMPRATWTQQAMTNDPEYAERVSVAIARSRLAADPDDKPSPPLTEHTPEVAALASVVDAINGLRRDFIAANSAPGKSAPQIPPHPRPSTLVDTMVAKKERLLRWTAHESLADRVLSKRNKT